MNQKTSTAGIFWGGLLLLVIYLLVQRNQVEMPTGVFFISIGLVVASLLYRILALDLTPAFSGMVILEITVAAIAFHLIYQLPAYGLYGTDAYFDLASLRAIMESGHIGGVGEYVQITTFFPVFHVLVSELALVTGIDYFTVAKWFPSVIGTFSIPVLYLMVRHFFKHERAALLAALLYASLQHYILFGSLFIREPLAVVFALGCVYFYFSAGSSKNPVSYRLLSIFLLAVTVLAHHMTSVMLIAVLAIYWLFTLFARSSRDSSLPGTTENERLSFSFLIIGAVGVAAYWITTVVEPVQLLMRFMGDIFSPSLWGASTILGDEQAVIMSVPDLRYFFLIYGSYFCFGIFGLLLLHRSVFRRPETPLAMPAFTAYFALCGLIGVMSFFVLPATIEGDRFLSFGWLFACGPLALIIVQLRGRFTASLGISLVLVFLFINLFTIHPTVWNWKEEGAGGGAVREDYALATSVDFRHDAFLGYMNNIMAIYHQQNQLGTQIHLLTGKPVWEIYDRLIINRESLTAGGLYTDELRMLLLELKELDNNPGKGYHRIYESPNISVLQQRL